MSWKDRYTVIRTDTTGVKPGSRIIQVESATFLYGKCIDAKAQLINPHHPIRNSEYHGITDAHVANCPAFMHYAAALLEIIQDAPVVVCWMHEFHLEHLYQEMLGCKLGGQWSDIITAKPILDPMVLVKSEEVGAYWRNADVGDGTGRYKLPNVAAKLELPETLVPFAQKSVQAGQILWALQFVLDGRDDPHKAAEWCRVLGRVQER